jgi:hypothetical protein
VDIVNDVVRCGWSKVKDVVLVVFDREGVIQRIGSEGKKVDIIGCWGTVGNEN